jgi:hypothetical protein
MNQENASLLAEVVACRHTVEDYANRIDIACVEYYENGKTLFPHLSRAEDEDTSQQCELILSRLTSIMPDAMSRWQSIEYPSGQYKEMIERMRDLWVRRRNLLRTVENTLRTKLELDSHSSKDRLISSAREAEKISRKTILFLAADPSDATRLRLGEEFREINDSLRKAQMREAFRLALPQLSVRPPDISQAILDEKPRIIHFSGHGMSSGELCFEDATGGMQTVQADALAALFELVANEIECVILNACYSAIQAHEITKHIDYVIGMNEAIGDKAAISFAIGFYQALGAGRSIEDAYRFGCVQIRLQSIPEHLTPVLIKKAQWRS